jgi:anti-anti-sigma factor
MSLSGKFLAGSDGPYLRQKVKDFIDAGTRKLILDFSEVPYIDSTGLGFLAGARVTAQNAGTRMVLANLNMHVQKILDDVKLSQFFVIAPNDAAAMAKVNEAGPLAQDAASDAAKRPRGKRRSIDPTES